MRFIWLLLLVSVKSISQAPAYNEYIPSSGSDTFAVIKDLIASVNDNQPSSVQKFTEKHFAGDMPRNEYDRFRNEIASLYRRTGGLQFHAIRHYQTNPYNDIVYIVRDQIFKEWRALRIRLREGKLSSLAIVSARAPQGYQSELLTGDEVIKRIESAVTLLCETKGFFGTILITHADKELLNKQCGEASKTEGRRINEETLFNLASVNKMFTSTAILQLAEQNNLQLTDTINKWIDKSWLPDTITSKITVHHLLTHMSGLGNFINGDFFSIPHTAYKTSDDYKSLFQNEHTAFAPGSQFQYSNSGMFLLGVIIEKVSGLNYDNFLRKNIFSVAGLSKTTAFPADLNSAAIGYAYTPYNTNEWTSNEELNFTGTAAGGYYSTASDMRKFIQALLAGRLISPTSLQKMTVNHAGNAGYGYGLFVGKTLTGESVIGHPGNFNGVDNSVDYFSRSAFNVIILSNYQDGTAFLKEYCRKLIGALQ